LEIRLKPCNLCGYGTSYSVGVREYHLQVGGVPVFCGAGAASREQSRCPW
jgi:hypothetical protein